MLSIQPAVVPAYPDVVELAGQLSDDDLALLAAVRPLGPGGRQMVLGYARGVAAAAPCVAAPVELDGTRPRLIDALRRQLALLPHDDVVIVAFSLAETHLSSVALWKLHSILADPSPRQRAQSPACPRAIEKGFSLHGD